MSEIDRQSVQDLIGALTRQAEANLREFWAARGLAVVSLPRLDYIDADEGKAVWAKGDVVKAKRGASVYDPHGDPMSPDEARDVAAALLAAALYAEGVR
ncbi:hypothetical protein ABQE46_12935 [Mycobacteroides chelonae]